MARYTNPKFWQAVRALRREFAFPYPVLVRTVAKLPDKKDAANVTMHHENGSRWFEIDILRGDITTMKDCLCHEISHCLDWSDGSVRAVVRKRREHTARWGAIYAKCYRIVFETER